MKEKALQKVDYDCANVCASFVLHLMVFVIGEIKQETFDITVQDMTFLSWWLTSQVRWLNPFSTMT